MKPDRLLIVSCSARKCPTPGIAFAPALCRYDGPMFRMLRRRLHNHPRTACLVMSGRYGLISVHHPIENYDEPLDSLRNFSIAGDPRKKFGLPEEHGVFLPTGVFVSSQKYLAAVCAALASALPPPDSSLYAESVAGPPGKRVGAAMRWLENDDT